MIKIYFEKDETRKAELSKKFETELCPNSLKNFEQRLTQNGSGYLVGSSLTYADLYLVALLEWLGDKKETALGYFPHVHKLDQTVRAHPSIAAWLAKRPVTPM
jgi:glutathione S-transferase